MKTYVILMNKITGEEKEFPLETKALNDETRLNNRINAMKFAFSTSYIKEESYNSLEEYEALVNDYKGNIDFKEIKQVE